MLGNLDNKYLGRSIELASRAFRWWLDELTGMLPKAIRDLARPIKSRLIVDIGTEALILGRAIGDHYDQLSQLDILDDGHKFEDADLVGFRGKHEAGSPVAIRLSNQRALRRTLTLPVAVEPNLRQSLALQLDRVVPLKASQIYFDCRVISRDARGSGLLTVELAVIERAVVDDAVRLVRRLGLEPIALGLRDDARKEPHSFNFLSRQSPIRMTHSAARNLASTAAVTLLTTLAIMSVGGKNDRIIEYLNHEIGLASADTRESRELDREIDDLVSTLEFLHARKSSGSLLAELNELTEAVSDGSWLDEVQKREREVKIRGFSRDAARLLANIEASPLFENARFTAAVTQTRGGDLEHFELSFRATDAPRGDR